MLTIAVVAFAMVASPQQQTDTTVAAPAGARLALNNHSGSIHVSTWDRPAIRVRAQHGSRDVIQIDAQGAVVRIKANREYGMASFVEYDLTVPRSMALDLGGVETDITVEGVGGELSAESVDGSITVGGAGGAVNLSTVDGDITLDGGVGRIEVHGVDGDIQISRPRGDIIVETVDGDVTLEQVESSDVTVGTVSGDIQYEGTITDGRYGFTSHDGDVTLTVPASMNATVSVATFEGSFEADPEFRVQVTEARPGRRFSFTVGNGAARVELETFDGEIRLRRR